MILLILLAIAIVIIEALYLSGKAMKCPECGADMEPVEGWKKEVCGRCGFISKG